MIEAKPGSSETIETSMSTEWEEKDPPWRELDFDAELTLTEDTML
jgi:hypothetical protein